MGFGVLCWVVGVLCYVDVIVMLVGMFIEVDVWDVDIVMGGL